LNILMANVMCLHCSLQEEDISEHTSAKCHVFILCVNLLTIMSPRHRPYNIVEHTTVKTLLSTQMPSVMCYTNSKVVDH
jgi:hypothetical protein